MSDTLPGTVPLVADDKIILEPQPSQDPEDPLNWPLSEKLTTFGILCVGAILSAVLNPILATNSLHLLFEFKKPLNDIAMLTGYQLVGVACAGPFFNASCRLFGRRHTYIAGMMLMLAGSWWAAATDSYNALLGARIVQGLGVMPYEALLSLTVADLFFVHQRGLYYAVYAIAYIAGAFLGPIIVTQIIVRHNQQWAFGVLGGFCAVELVLVWLFVKETAYIRKNDATSAQIQARHSDSEEKSATTVDTTLVYQTSDRAVLRKAKFPSTYYAGLNPFSQRYSRANPINLLLRPLYLFFVHPAVFLGAALQAMPVGTTILPATIIAALFAVPPYSLTIQKISYLYAGPTVAAIIAFPLAGLSSDWFSKFIAKRFRSGIHEAETRLFVVLGMAICTAIGLFGFGRQIRHDTAEYRHTLHLQSAVPSAILFGFIVCAVVFANVATGAYFADAYPAIALDAYVSGLIVKNLVGYALTRQGFPWILRDGIVKTLDVLGGIQLGLCALAIPLWIFGKQIRRATYRSPFIVRALDL
ncbi:hypothetical protein PYCC9005_001728 [Savitreella phatthalungensis]